MTAPAAKRSAFRRLWQPPARFEDRSTDRRVTFLELARMAPSPVVELNKAVAVAMAQGPEEGLRLVEQLAESGALPDYHLLPATRADLLRRLERPAEAAVAYREALALAATETERRYLTRRLEETVGTA